MPDRLRRGWPFWALACSAGIATAAFVLACLALIAWSREEVERRDEAKVRDVESCERGNDLRRLLIQLGEADAEMVVGTIEALAPDDRETEILARLAPVLDAHRAVVASVELTDCDQVINQRGTSE